MENKYGQIKIEKCGIDGVFVIEPTIHNDSRGYFLENYNYADMTSAGLFRTFVQDNESKSCKGVLRGLHFQKKHPQAKLVRVVKGEVFDVAVDIRYGSKTFGQWFGVVLSEKNKKQLYIDEGLAHGFLVLSEEAVFQYKVSDFYHPDDEGEIAWNDPDLEIYWPGIQGKYNGSASPEGYTMADGTQLILSEKDRKAPPLKDIQFEKYSTNMIPFNAPPFIGNEIGFIREALRSKKLCGDGPFTKKCNAWLENKTKAQKVLLTTSGTTALDMALLLCNFQPGDEVILPSYTFSSTATAAVLAGARLVFVDIRPDTMNIDENKIEDAITEKTKAIIVVHYAGVSCEMDKILEIARCYNLFVIEDAAQGVMSLYKGKALGTMGDFGCYSFHETKNYTMGEGGAILIKNKEYNERAEILREKGTNRSKFYRGQVDKYTWIDFGDSYLPSELNAAYLWGQLNYAEKINEHRLDIWNRYYEALLPLAQAGRIELPFIPEGCTHNAHLFFVKCKDLEERTEFIQFLKEHNIQGVFHYIPLHSSPAGRKFGRFHGIDQYTTVESERLVRLPMYYDLTVIEQNRILKCVKCFFAR